jgi:hypothetical protein
MWCPILAVVAKVLYKWVGDWVCGKRIWYIQ